jgi:hypothetical protein
MEEEKTLRIGKIWKINGWEEDVFVGIFTYVYVMSLFM